VRDVIGDIILRVSFAGVARVRQCLEFVWDVLFVEVVFRPRTFASVSPHTVLH
jgi:hypothetical protein